MTGKRRPYPDLDAMEVHAAPQAIRAHLEAARKRQADAARTVARLEALLERRLGQVERGEWPHRPPVLKAAEPPRQWHPSPDDTRLALVADSDVVKPVSEFTAAEKWWCDGEDCDGEYEGPHVHAGWGASTLAVDLRTGRDERHPGYVKRDDVKDFREVPR